MLQTQSDRRLEQNLVAMSWENYKTEIISVNSEREGFASWDLFERSYLVNRGASALKSRKNGLRINGLSRSLVGRSVVTKFSFQFWVTKLRMSLVLEKHKVWWLWVVESVVGAGDGSGLIDRKDKCLEMTFNPALSEIPWDLEIFIDKPEGCFIVYPGNDWAFNRSEVWQISIPQICLQTPQHAPSLIRLAWFGWIPLTRPSIPRYLTSRKSACRRSLQTWWRIG